MKLLLDTCLSRSARETLVRARHDVVWTAEEEDPGDRELLERARHEGRVLITLDKDFGELAIVRGLTHAGIVRLVGFHARSQGTACEAALAKYSQELSSGAIVTVEPWRVRLRPG